MIPTRKDGYKLLHDGCIALAEVEANGIRIDVPRLERRIQRTGEQIKELEAKLFKSNFWKEWKTKFKNRSNMNSPVQMGSMLEASGCELDKTKTGRTKTDAVSLAKLDDPFVKDFLAKKKLEKLKSTYLTGVMREVVDGFLHPVFNLHLVSTYRSSSDSPNFQNLPIRDPEVGKIIRECFIPRDKHVLVEVDYSALEVRISACYNDDPTLIEYIQDPTKDMHRDMAAECYLLDQDQVTKTSRFYAKNQFVFPQFYGSYWGLCAPNLWKAIDEGDLATVDGVPLKEHLSDNGVYELGSYNSDERPKQGTFMRHIQNVEDNFWNERFPVYQQWKKDWWEQYLETGGFDILTGFRIDGVHKRNDVINYPVQGAAFHCLLWSLIQIQKRIRKRGMKSKIVGQIHDSIIADVYLSELQDYLNLAKQTMTKDLLDHWDWIIVPLDVEVEVGEENWWNKKEWTSDNDIWSRN